jgi:hypothetical protein
MRISRITIVGAVAATMIAGGAGLAVASTSTVQRPAASGTEHFNLMTTQPSASKYVVVASGLFTAGGVDLSGNTVDLIKLTGGTFKINHGSAVHIIKEKFNPKTCLMDFAATAKFTVEKGTGAYKHISGSGKALISGLAIARRSKGQCDQNANPVVSEQTITATAHIKL